MNIDILDFSQKLISKCLPIKVHRLSQSMLNDFLSLEHSEFHSMIYYHLTQCLHQYFLQCKTSTIYNLITPFHTHYTILCLSKEEDEYLLLGPFMENPIDESMIYPIINNLQLTLDYAVNLKFYYQSIPFIENTKILEILYTIHESITQSSPLPEVHTLDLSILTHQDSSYTLLLEDMNRTSMYKAIEERYAEEEKMLSYITSGDVILAQSHWENSPIHLQSLSRLQDSLRNRKDLLIVANTLFRKAAQAGGVHPIYLDEISSKWAIRIEQTNSFAELDAMPRKMIHAYCLLTKNRSMAQYSPIVQKALTFIHLNLSSSLSVKKIANEVNLSPDYLTRLFKKELNITVICYINTKRIYKSLKLLATTNLSIGEIGDLVGLSNTAYFHTLFKKEIGLSPNQYRKQLKSN